MKKKLKFKKLMNEYRAQFYELEYVKEVLKEAHTEFNEYYAKFCAKKKVQLSKLNQKHESRVKQLFTPQPGLSKKIVKQVKENEYDAKKLFRQIAKKFHPDTLALDDPRVHEFEEVFKKATSAIDNCQWGELFNIADTYNLQFDDYESVNSSLVKDIQRIKKDISGKKDTYAWLLYHCETDAAKDEIIKRFLNHVYVDYRDPT